MAMEMTLYSHESMKKNKMGKNHQKKCTIRGEFIEVDEEKSMLKKMIRMSDLHEVEMNEKITINKHRQVNIICLKQGNEIFFLKAENSTQMLMWYNELMKSLGRMGWIDLEPESTIEGTKRRATNPEGMTRPDRRVGNTRKTVSAVDPDGFYEIPNAECRMPNAKDATVYETYISESPNDASNDTKKGLQRPLPPPRKESLKELDEQKTYPDDAADTDSSDDGEYTELCFPTDGAVDSTAPTTNVPSQSTAATTNVPSKSTAATKNVPSQSTPKDFKQVLERAISKRQAVPPVPQTPIKASNTPSKSNVTTIPPVQVTSGNEYSIDRTMPPLRPLISRKPRPSIPIPPINSRGRAHKHHIAEMDRQLKAYVDNFRKCQDEDSITVTLKKDDVSKGKLVCMVKVQKLTCLWFYRWNFKDCPREGTLHPGDQILSINGIDLEDCDTKFAYQLITKVKGDEIPMTVRRAPYANLVHLQRNETCNDLGIEVDGHLIKKVSPDGLFYQTSGRAKTRGVLSTDLVEWAITEINMQHINFNHTTKQIQDLLQKENASEVVLVIQPSDLVQAMKEALVDCPQCGGVAACQH